jgi:hypothetical protein
MANKPVLNIAEAYAKIKASKFNENFDILLDYIEEVSEELTLKVDTINSQLSSSVLSNLQSVYPIGSLYIGITDTCPIANLFGTWEKVADGLCLQGANSSQVAGTTVSAGLPNITGVFKAEQLTHMGNVEATGALYKTTGIGTTSVGNIGTNAGLGFDASRSNSIYGKSDTVQPPSYLVNIWKRTA